MFKYLKELIQPLCKKNPSSLKPKPTLTQTVYFKKGEKKIEQVHANEDKIIGINLLKPNVDIKGEQQMPSKLQKGREYLLEKLLSPIDNAVPGIECPDELSNLTDFRTNDTPLFNTGEENCDKKKAISKCTEQHRPFFEDLFKTKSDLKKSHCVDLFKVLIGQTQNVKSVACDFLIEKLVQSTAGKLIPNIIEIDDEDESQDSNPFDFRYKEYDSNKICFKNFGEITPYSSVEENTTPLSRCTTHDDTEIKRKDSKEIIELTIKNNVIFFESKHEEILPSSRIRNSPEIGKDYKEVKRTENKEKIIKSSDGKNIASVEMEHEEIFVPPSLGGLPFRWRLYKEKQVVGNKVTVVYTLQDKNSIPVKMEPQVILEAKRTTLPIVFQDYIEVKNCDYKDSKVYSPIKQNIITTVIKNQDVPVPSSLSSLPIWKDYIELQHNNNTDLVVYSPVKNNIIPAQIIKQEIMVTYSTSNLPVVWKDCVSCNKDLIVYSPVKNYVIPVEVKSKELMVSPSISLLPTIWKENKKIKCVDTIDILVTKVSNNNLKTDTDDDLRQRVILNKSSYQEQSPDKPITDFLQETYLVSFKVNEDEAYFKERRQTISNEIKSDTVDLNTVIEQENEAKREKKNRKVPQYRVPSREEEKKYLTMLKNQKTTKYPSEIKITGEKKLKKNNNLEDKYNILKKPFPSVLCKDISRHSESPIKKEDFRKQFDLFSPSSHMTVLRGLTPEQLEEAKERIAECKKKRKEADQKLDSKNRKHLSLPNKTVDLKKLSNLIDMRVVLERERHTSSQRVEMKDAIFAPTLDADYEDKILGNQNGPESKVNKILHDLLKKRELQIKKNGRNKRQEIWKLEGLDDDGEGKKK